MPPHQGAAEVVGVSLVHEVGTVGQGGGALGVALLGGQAASLKRRQRLNPLAVDALTAGARACRSFGVAEAGSQMLAACASARQNESGRRGERERSDLMSGSFTSRAIEPVKE